ncbi:uroporphyrinogen-III C-methyltransferase [Paenibacillus pini]|uniref:Uncharacterized protein n=1 Tax=Paenibacillus pini JCM 16418 TaxID=1236976 RepID=W7YCQ4_9BACL|nr:uroporphyrinogen-III C-methyltransferase [Paenibacillus pini]GAF06232.1 hypothetical protein JCM16418_182 [Paenibacillus pini JCM 16418]
MQSSTETSKPYRASTNTRKGPSVKWVLLVWIVLIGLGISAAYWYSNHMKQDMLQQLQADNRQQISILKKSYEAKLTTLSAEVQELENKVQSFNELLTFTKDNATNKTDNSNKLYTQLSEVKKQLNTLQKQMDLLK